ncbi:MAG TPA: TonB-dependent receptor, partial [Balneolaceae bacterium]|nr:TonB-dependent receptor [Balneolaceae bacterium]
ERVLYGNEGLISNTQISVSGGNEKTQFYVSANFEQEEGIIKNTGFERRSVRANLDHNISEAVHISSHSNYIHTDSDRGFSSNQNNTGGSVGYTLAMTPNYAYGLLQQNADGTYPDNPYFGENPFRLINEAVNSQNVDRFLQSLSVKAELFKKGSSVLSLSAAGGLDYLTANSLIYFPNYMQSQKSAALPGDVIHSMHESLNLNMQAVMAFNTTVKSGPGLFILGTQLGVTRFDHKTELNRLRGQGLLPGQTNVGNASRVTPTQFFTDVTDVGFFGQQKINWDDKLIATVGARLDRSTRNLLQDEYYFYPKASLAANLPNFEFWPTDVFDQFKLRIAYGETGGLPAFGQTFLSMQNANIGGAVGATASISGVDPNLKPERARELEYGLDLAFLDGRISFSGTIYTKTVSELILNLAPAPSTGVNSVTTNAAELENRGIELSLNVAPVRSRNFNWNATFLWWKNDTEITELKIPAQYNGFYFGATRFEEGVSPTAIFGTKPGVEGRVMLGNFQPDYQMSWANSMTFWGNLKFSFFWDVSQGSKLINLSTLLTDGSGNTVDYWDNYPELPERFSQGTATTRFLEDGSFIKLREVSLQYTLPKDLLNKAFGNTVRGIKVGVSGRNLLTITDYSGYDPDVNVTGRSTLRTSVSIVPYPPSRQLMFHINLDF